MAIQPCYLINDDYEMVHYGIALVDTVTGLPLPLSRNVLTTLEEAEAFLLWVWGVVGQDARMCDAGELEKLGLEWRAKHQPDECLTLNTGSKNDAPPKTFP